MIKSSIVNAVLDEALRTGGDFSELYLQDTESNTMTMIDGKVENANYKRNVGAGVRVLKGTRSAYAYSAETSEAALIACAKAAASALKGEKEYSVIPICVDRIGESFAKIPFSEINNAKRIELLRRATNAAKSYSAEVTQVVANYLDCDHRTWVYNSEGVHAEDRRPRVRTAVQAVAMANGEAQTGTCSPGYGMGFEAYNEKINIDEVGAEAAKTAATMLHAPECPAGTVPVVIDGGFGGV
ncbi:MAG: TldD/PmbA family protein, partial [Clostridia bacterium]|nr:TldD/PmbA family protein [Clostridia bacterium]